MSNVCGIPGFMMNLLSKQYRHRPMYSSGSICYYRSGFHGHGLFLTAGWRKGQVLTEYCGEVIGKLLVELRDAWY